ncbi:Salicylate hydroxylase [Mycena venus]|uniref:Salicylate hydroxylase n=1 Tax=Mycena venus TaxID=2733690 RepID=A0A8H6Z388_9AGAR|nr:Salicylate hydroxylase [Mycena venus]
MRLRGTRVNSEIGELTNLCGSNYGRTVDTFERRDFDVEVGASVSCAANGTQWLREWEVDIPDMKPVILMNLVMREWETGKVLNDYKLDKYEEEWGYVYNMFHRQDMHKTLLETATATQGRGTPCRVFVDHICDTVDAEAGTVTFKNGVTSVVRRELGIVPGSKSAPQTCYRCNVLTEDVKKLGLVDYSYAPAIQYWGGVAGKNGRSKYYWRPLPLGHIKGKLLEFRSCPIHWPIFFDGLIVDLTRSVVYLPAFFRFQSMSIFFVNAFVYGNKRRSCLVIDPSEKRIYDSVDR